MMTVDTLTNSIFHAQDNSGTISTEELLHVLRAMGQNPSEEELNGIIMEIDIDGSGTIDFFEFVNLMKEKASEVDIDNDIRCHQKSLHWFT